MTTHQLELCCYEENQSRRRLADGDDKHVLRSPCKLGQTALLFALVTSLLVAPPTNCDQNAAAGPVPSVEDSNLVNLNDILKHQQALAAECRRLEKSKLLELEQVVEAEQRQGGGNQQAHEPIALRLPAVCLLLNGPPTIVTNKPSSNDNQSKRQQQQLRLDLVNWLYDYDDLIDELQQAGRIANNKTKRQVATTSGFGPIIEDQLASNEIDLMEGPPDERLFRAQLEQMIDDNRYQEAVRLDQAKIGALLSPVVLVPGLAGSRLQARVSKLNRVNIICKKEHDWMELWLSVRSFLPIAIDCWIDNVRLEFDPASGFTRPPAGVETRAPQFGSVESVRHLDLKSPKLTKYFDTIIERYIKIGYQPDKNLFAAPYDFRLAPQEIQASFFEPLRQLIDKASAGGADGDLQLAGGSLGRMNDIGTSLRTGAAAVAAAANPTESKRVTLVCHSMGCTHLLVFLRQQTSAWRRARVRKVVAISSPWGGAAKALKALLVGEQFNLPIVSELKMRELERTFPSVAYLLPQAEVYSKPTGQQVDFGGPVLVQTPLRNYRSDQLEELLREVGLEQHWHWFQKSTSLIKPMEPLDDVPMDCLHGLNVPTLETIVFRNQTDFPDGDYELITGDGDGTVNHQSLLVCADWASKLPHLIRHKIISNVSHTGMLTHKHVLEYLTEEAATD